MAPGAHSLPEVTATFDAQGDGALEAREELSYEEFVGALFQYLQ